MGDRGGLLAGIRVIELGTMIAGPVAGTLLGDFGAEIIKLEDPKAGDPIRMSGTLVEGESLYWNVEGRNKRSVTVDMRQPQGQDILHKLVAEADVLVENFRPGTMQRWNSGYDVLKKINPRLIMLSISGYGQTGPNAELPSYDRVALAFSGFLHITGYPDLPPVRPGTAIADYQTALYGAFSIMLALYHRDARGGDGQHLDLSLFETIFRFTDTMVTAYDKVGLPRERRGNAHYAASPGDHYMLSDGRYLAMTVAATSVFQRLCIAIRQEELAKDPRFATHPSRVENYDIINSIVADWMKSRPASEVLDQLKTNSVPHSLIYSVQDIVADPHYAARGSIATIQNPRIGALKMPAVFPIMSGTPAPELRPAPSLGEDTIDVLTKIARMDAEAIANLKAQGVI